MAQMETDRKSSYEMMLGMDGRQLREYLRPFSALKVMDAFEAAFGSAQVLAYEKDILGYIIRCLNKADEPATRRFADVLDGCQVTCDSQVRMLGRDSAVRADRKFSAKCGKRNECVQLSLFPDSAFVSGENEAADN